MKQSPIEFFVALVAVVFSLGIARGAVADDDQDREGILAAREALVVLGERHESLSTLQARYLQERSSMLMKEPMQSSGQVFFRKEPGCLIFRGTKPAVVVIRLDTDYYQVYRPDKKQLERFPLEDQEWPKALFRTFAHRVDELRDNFKILGSRVEKAPSGSDIRVIRFAPKSEKLRQRMTSLRVGIHEDNGLLANISYTDAQGDEVKIVLEGLALDGKIPAKEFELNPAAGTRVITHKVAVGR